MLDDMIKPSDSEWRCITGSSRRFATDNPRQLHETPYTEVLTWAKKEANRHGNPVRTAAWYGGRWYLVDTAYPDNYAD